MGFEDFDESKGFEADSMDLDNNEAVQLGTGRIKASRKRGIKTEHEAPVMISRRDKFGRRGNSVEDYDDEQQMLAPDRPTRLSAGPRRASAQQTPKKVVKSNSSFSYLFDDSTEYEGENETSISEKSSRIAALAFTGEESESDDIFSNPVSAVDPERFVSAAPRRQSTPPPETMPEPEPQEPPQEKKGRFSRSKRAEKDNTAEAKPDITELPVFPAEKPEAEQAGTFQLPPPPRKTENLPARRVDFSLSEAQMLEREPELRPQLPAAPSQRPDLGFDGSRVTNPDEYIPQPEQLLPPPLPQAPGYGFQQLPQGQQGGYMPPYPYPQPYGAPPYSPYGAAPYPPYPPYGYVPVAPVAPVAGRPGQYVPAGYVYQPGYAPPVHIPVRRRKRPGSSARAEHRYDRNPMRDELRAQQESREESVYDLPPLTGQASSPQPSQVQIDRMLDQIPEEPTYTSAQAQQPPVEMVAPPEFETLNSEVSEEDIPEPERDYMRGGAEEQVEEQTEQPRFKRRSVIRMESVEQPEGRPASRFARRSSGEGARTEQPDTAQVGSDSYYSEEGFDGFYDEPTAPPAPSTARFRKRS